MKGTKENTKIFILCMIELISGILLMINPSSFARFIFGICGVVLITDGALNCIRYMRTEAREAARSQLFARGIIMLVVGVAFCFKYSWITSLFPLLNLLFGIMVLLSGLIKSQWCLDTLRLHRCRWLLPVISTTLSLVCAFLLIKDPFAGTDTLWLLSGSFLIFASVCDGSSIFLCKSKI